jgi:hypothetical protein
MRIYRTDNKVTCGPCAFINLTGIKGNKKLEHELSEIGRLKPFHASDYISFLIWAKRFGLKFEVFTKYRKPTKSSIKSMKVSGMIKSWKTFETSMNKRVKRYSGDAHILKDPIKTLNSLLENDYKVAVITSNFYARKNPTPHWIVAYKKEGKKYFFMDSSFGNINLTEKQLMKGFRLNKNFGFCPQLVAYKPK